MYDFVHNTLLQELVEKEKDESNNEDVTKEDVMKKLGLTSLCIQTIYNWMNQFGFKYSPHRKTYYVNGHEKADTVEYRKGYITQYLANEIRSHRWIQLPISRVEALEKEFLEFNRDDGFEYENNNLTFFEFHIDYHECFTSEWQTIGVPVPEFGANLSVRKKESEKQIIMIGQDKCIFKQFLFSHKHWALPDDTTPPMPKEEGQGVMLSSFVSREFGYGFTLSQAQLDHVN